MTEKTLFDSPDDIKTLGDFTIKAANGTLLPEIYANGRNQLPIEIYIKAYKSDGKTPVNLPDETWRKMLSLCFADGGKELVRNAKEGWSFTDVENDYSGEINSKTNIRGTSPSVKDDDNGKTLNLYLYTYVDKVRRISVKLNTGTKVFDTSDNPSGNVEKMSVTVNAKTEIAYDTKNINFPQKPSESVKTKNKVTYTETNITSRTYTREFDCQYFNYDITAAYEIRNAKVYGYGSVEKWISAYDSEHDNQHMIVAHPFNKEEKVKELFGFKNTATWRTGGPKVFTDHEADFDLTQNVTYNETRMAICFTHMAFSTGDVWELPDNKGLDKRPFNLDPWFELYDKYGNYGKFTISFLDDHTGIKITSRA